MNPKTPVRSALLMVGILVLLVGAPAVGAMVYDATNAHKVDGKHAVSAGVSASKRAGKLVATDASGHLPNDIIKKANDSAKLGGLASAGYLKSKGLIAVPFFGPWFPGYLVTPITQGPSYTTVHSDSVGTTILTPAPVQFPSVLFGKVVEIVKVEICYDATDPDVKLKGDLVLANYSQTEPGSSSGNYAYEANVDFGDSTCRMFSSGQSTSSLDGPQPLGPTSFVNLAIPVTFVNDGGDFIIGRTTYYFRMTHTDA
jgi:hypothetical protein